MICFLDVRILALVNMLLLNQVSRYFYIHSYSSKSFSHYTIILKLLPMHLGHCHCISHSLWLRQLSNIKISYFTTDNRTLIHIKPLLSVSGLTNFTGKIYYLTINCLYFSNYFQFMLSYTVLEKQLILMSQSHRYLYLAAMLEDAIILQLGAKWPPEVVSIQNLGYLADSRST